MKKYKQLIIYLCQSKMHKSIIIKKLSFVYIFLMAFHIFMKIT